MSPLEANPDWMIWTILVLLLINTVGWMSVLWLKILTKDIEERKDSGWTLPIVSKKKYKAYSPTKDPVNIMRGETSSFD